MVAGKSADFVLEWLVHAGNNVFWVERQVGVLSILALYPGLYQKPGRPHGGNAVLGLWRYPRYRTPSTKVKSGGVDTVLDGGAIGCRRS
jgi:hypothetical protein